MTFREKLADIQRKKSSVLCVGLDPDIERIPPTFEPDLSPTDRILAFNTRIIAATEPYACAYKLNFAFYERYGSKGWQALEQTRTLIPPTALAIADNKRGDIGNSARFYAQSVFETLSFDACTVSPYMGMDTITPFLQYPGTAAFVLARTSNPGAADLQEHYIGDTYVYESIAKQVADLAGASSGQPALVVGATSPAALARLRAIAPTLPFLIPGVGAQGGDPQAVMQAASAGAGSVLVNSSRGVLYASSGQDFEESARGEAQRLAGRLGT